MTEEVNNEAIFSSNSVEAVPEKPRKRLIEIVKDYLFLFLISGTIAIIDQFTKSIVRANIPYQGTWDVLPWLQPFVRIVNWSNSGVAFGLGQAWGDVFTGLAIFVILAMILYFPFVLKDEWALRLALAMQLGGALGNLTDRLQFGRVTDFISVGSFPVFNVADSCITVGVGVLIVGIYLKEKEMRAEEMAAKMEKNQAEHEPHQVELEDGVDLDQHEPDHTVVERVDE